MNQAANWVAVVSTVCCVFLLVSWAVLPVEKTYRHYLSICLTIGVLFMNVCCCSYPFVDGLILTCYTSLALSSR